MFFTASAKTFSNGNEDVNGNLPMILSPITGQSPRGINVISGTSAELYGIEDGGSYVIKATEFEPEDKGWQEGASDKDGNLIRQFGYEKVTEIPIETVVAEAIRPVKAGEVKLKIVINKPSQGWLKAVEATDDVVATATAPAEVKEEV